MDVADNPRSRGGFAHLAAPLENPLGGTFASPLPFSHGKFCPPNPPLTLINKTSQGITEEPGEGAQSLLLGAGGGGMCFCFK